MSRAKVMRADEVSVRHVATLREELRLARGRATLYEAALREIASPHFESDPVDVARKTLAQGER